MGLPSSVTDMLTLLLAMLIATLLSMIVGELLPKGLAIAEPYAVARRVAPHSWHSLASCPRSCVHERLRQLDPGRFGMEAKEELSAARTPEELSPPWCAAPQKKAPSTPTRHAS